MKLKYLLLGLTVGFWLVASAIVWPIRPYLTTDFIEYCCRLAMWTAQAQLAAILIPLVGKSSIRPVLVAALIADVQLTIYWFHGPPEPVANRFIQFAMYQAAVLLPLTIAARFLGFRLAQSATLAQVSPSTRQYSLATLLLWTAAAAAYFLLLRNLDLRIVGQWFVVAFFVLFPPGLASFALWAALGNRGLLWRTALLVALVIGAANLLHATDSNDTFSAWQAACVVGSPTLLVWLTCVTLRAFGWRLVRQKLQPLPPVVQGPVAENA